jgi:type II secretory pathway predicted ATPase ExeA
VNGSAARLRAFGYLRAAGADLGSVSAALGRSRSTWSRLLRGILNPEPDGIRGELETFYRSLTGRPVPRDFWRRERSVPVPTDKSGSPLSIEDTTMLQRQTLSTAAMKAFNLTANPFDDAAMGLPDGRSRIPQLMLPHSHAVAVARMVNAIKSSDSLAVAGESGSGKSTLFRRALYQAEATCRVNVIHARNIDRRSLTPGHISSQIILELRGGDKPLPSSAHEKDAEAERLLSDRYREYGERSVLLIDDAHNCREETLRSLKAYAEWRTGFARLLAVIVIGQTELAKRFQEKTYALREVIQRIPLVTVGPMSGQTAAYVASRLEWFGLQVEDVFEDGALEWLESYLQPRGWQYPLLVNNAATAAMNIAVARGLRSRVAEDDFEAVWQYSPDELQALCL